MKLQLAALTSQLRSLFAAAGWRKPYSSSL